MQYDEMELRAQQLVLAFLGFYNGAIDGIWSDATIRAMKAFECEDSFLPAVPTFGLPFRLNCRLPKGMYWDKRLVAHRNLTPEKARELLEKRSPKKPAEPTVTVAQEPAQATDEPAPETKGVKNAQK